MSNVDYYTFNLHSDLDAPYTLGSLELRLSNETARAIEEEQESDTEALDAEIIDSKVNGFNLATALAFKPAVFLHQPLWAD